MKKLLIFMLVLGMVSAANAAISALQVGGSDIGSTYEIDNTVVNGVTFQIYSNDANTWLGYIIIEEGGAGDLNSPTINATVGPGYAGDAATMNWYDEEGWGTGYNMSADYLSTAPQAGDQFTVYLDVSGLNVDDSGRISLWDDMVGYKPGQEVDYTVFTVIPEPATIALLGLGGLLLRRRKK